MVGNDFEKGVREVVQGTIRDQGTKKAWRSLWPDSRNMTPLKKGLNLIATQDAFLLVCLPACLSSLTNVWLCVCVCVHILYMCALERDACMHVYIYICTYSYINLGISACICDNINHKLSSHRPLPPPFSMFGNNRIEVTSAKFSVVLDTSGSW
jgi:hypothetical protein